MPELRFASIKARDLAEEIGLDPRQIEGTGRDGKITASDVRAAAPTLPQFGEAGAELWRAFMADLPEGWELDQRELSLVEMACRQADDLALLEEAIDRDGAMAIGSTKQIVVHPAVQEARQARLAIGRLLGLVRIPNEDGRGEAESSRRARHAASVRHGG